MEKKNNSQLALIMPVGSNFGWGVCGQYLSKELAKLTRLQLATDPVGTARIENEDEYSFLKPFVNDQDITNLSVVRNGDYPIHSPVLQAIAGGDLKPWLMRIQSPMTVGYTFFEKSRIEPKNIEAAKTYYKKIIAGSKWCEGILNSCGYLNTATVIQGINPELFYDLQTEKTLYQDRFVIFSGGKLELRKGQDIVIRAFKVLQDKFDDVLLINAWYNLWDQSVCTMQLSPYIRFEMPKGDYSKAINHLLAANGIDVRNVMTLPSIPNREMPTVYRNSDIGLFPNRCEGGTNLVLMEYMACGKPVIASYTSGHQDILTDENSVPIKSLQPFNVQTQDGKLLFQWDDPNFDEVVSKLEWAYWHREELKEIGKNAGIDLSQTTWSKSARNFYDIIFQD